MSGDYTLEFNQVWKRYSRRQKGYTLSQTLTDLWKAYRSGGLKKQGELREDEFWAVKDVSFKLKRGEVLGIIGPNGAGKSTILKMLSELSVPTKGNCHTVGRLSAIIEVTAGFHPDFTGRENVYFNGTILGMTKKQIDAKFDEIVEFSGIKKFIDTPVKYYSSGMGARLGFSVACNVDPDVLLVDEVLSVGDAAFREKCTEKMRSLLESGKTIIIVSHNVAFVQNLCHRVIVLDQGQIIKEDKPAVAVPFYQELMNQRGKAHLEKVMARPENVKQEKEHARSGKRQKFTINIPKVRVTDPKGNSKESYSPEEPIMIEIDYDVEGVIKKPVFVVKILRQDDLVCNYLNSSDVGYDLDKIEGKGTVQIDLEQTSLTPGVYLMKVEVWDEKMIHPFISIKDGIFKIELFLRHEYSESIFITHSTWKTKPNKS